MITLPERDDRAAPQAEDVAAFARRCELQLLRFAYLPPPATPSLAGGPPRCGDRQHAEDLLQEALLAMYRRFPGPLPLDNPIGYARRALANANISRGRRGSNREVVLDLFPDAAAPSTLDPAERDLLWRALRKLAVRQRTVLVLRFYADAEGGVR